LCYSQVISVFAQDALQAQMVIKKMSEMIETSPAALSPIESSTTTTTITTTVQPDDDNNLSTTDACNNTSRDEENNVTVSRTFSAAKSTFISVLTTKTTKLSKRVLPINKHFNQSFPFQSCLTSISVFSLANTPSKVNFTFDFVTCGCALAW